MNPVCFQTIIQPTITCCMMSHDFYYLLYTIDQIKSTDSNLAMFYLLDFLMAWLKQPTLPPGWSPWWPRTRARWTCALCAPSACCGRSSWCPACRVGARAEHCSCVVTTLCQVSRSCWSPYWRRWPRWCRSASSSCSPSSSSPSSASSSTLELCTKLVTPLTTWVYLLFVLCF